ncbi:MAG: alpha/beta hydrolase [Cardiobacteriaceae bacterium]|nr:alpha/beta hydrolase [Cardiobacteriaceae bacterium]
MQSFYSASAQCYIRFHDFPGHGLPCLFVHGLGCAASYEYPLVVLDATWGGRRAILPDRPGSGFSDWPSDFSYSTTAQAQVLVELAEHLDLQRFILYGHSMGGSIAIEAASRMPARIAALLLSESNFHAGGGFFSRQIIAQSETEFVVRGHAHMVATDGTAWAGCLQRSAPHAIWRAAKSLVDGVTPSWMELFLALDAPRLFIVSEHSLPDEDIARFATHGIDSAIVPHAGHSMSWENPHGLAAVMAAWLDKIGL